MLGDSEIQRHTAGMAPEQAESLRRFRAMVHELDPGLDESFDANGMFAGMLTFRRDGEFVYAVGPKAGGKVSLHLFPYYVSPELQERHGASMKKVLTGKRCLAFRLWEDLPRDAIKDSVRSGSQRILDARRDDEEARRNRASAGRKVRKGQQ